MNVKGCVYDTEEEGLFTDEKKKMKKTAVLNAHNSTYYKEDK